MDGLKEAWKEEIKITVLQPTAEDSNTKGITEAMKRIAQLERSKHDIVNAYLEEETQVYILRKKEEA